MGACLKKLKHGFLGSKRMSEKGSVCIFLIGLLFLGACHEKEEGALESEGGGKMAIKITSAAFKNEGMIPSKYTCDGDDISPPLAWEGIPEGTKSIALISDDPDAPAGTWVHWVMFNIPAEARELS